MILIQYINFVTNKVEYILSFGYCTSCVYSKVMYFLHINGQEESNLRKLSIICLKYSDRFILEVFELLSLCWNLDVKLDMNLKY